MASSITDFVFDNHKLSDFGFMLCSFNSDGSETKPVSEINFNTFKAPHSDRWIKTSSNYEAPLSTVVQICKNPCYDEVFSINDRQLSELSKWLCRKQFKEFRFLNCMYDNITFNVQIKTSKIVMGDDVVGLELSITANKPYGQTELFDLHFSATREEPFNVIVNTDEEGILYPEIVRIKCLENGTLSLHHLFDGRNTVVANCVSGEILTFDGKTLQLTSTHTEHNVQNDFNYEFPHLCSLYDEYENKFISNMNVEIDISYYGARKVGL